MQRKDKRSWFFWIERTIILWLGGVLGFMLIDYLSVGLTVNSWETAFVVVALLGILNALFWPLLSRIFLPFMVFTVGVGSLLLNGFLIWIISNFVPGITVARRIGPPRRAIPLRRRLRAHRRRLRLDQYVDRLRRRRGLGYRHATRRSGRRTPARRQAVHARESRCHL